MSSRLISNAVEELIPENKLRKSLTIQNEDASIDCYIKLEEPGGNTCSATDHDHRIGPGGAAALNTLLDGEAAIQSRWTIIAASGTPRISIFETEEKDR